MEAVPHADAGEFARIAGPLLETDPVRHTSVLTVLHGVQTGAFDPVAMLTVHEDGAVVGALLRTAGRPALVSAVPPRCSGAVVDALVALDPEPDGIQGPTEEAEAVAAAWSARTGDDAEVQFRMRLFALDELRAPAGIAGAARAVGPDDAAGLDMLAAWRVAFGHEIGRAGRRPHTERDDVEPAVVTGSGELVWEVHGEPVAQASARSVVAGMSRIGPVYTLPEHRNHGYAAAVTAAAARWALDRGARHVLLYTDLANPTTNRLYPRLGFRARYDALELRFGPSLEPAPPA
jgi:GNAT superfamily N-acetyltransferase